MAVMERDVWSEKRLTGLEKKVDEGFEEMRTEFKAVRAEMHAGAEALRSEMHAGAETLRGEMHAGAEALRGEMREGSESLRREMQGELRGIRGEMGELRAELSAFNRTVVQVLWALIGTIFLGLMGTIAALFTLV